MKIAVIGAGFAGLSTCYYLLNQGAEVHVFDKLGIGKGASGISAGLLHPYKSDYSRHITNGDEYYQEALKLIKVSEEYENNVILNHGILKLALTPQEISLFSELDQTDTEFWDEKKTSCQYFSSPALFVKSGILISSTKYLSGLWKACEKKGARLYIEEINDLEKLSEYDHIVVTVGAQIVKFNKVFNLDLEVVKGQILVLDSKGIEPLTYPVNGGVYVVQPEPNSLIVGATYEHNSKDLNPDIEYTKKILLPKLEKISPILANLPVKACISEGRVSTPNKKPIITRYENIWAFTGLGSKGLLCHGYYGRKLAHAILDKN